MVPTVRWYRCEVPSQEAGDFTGRLVEQLAMPYAICRDRKWIAIYDSIGPAVDPVSVWLTEKAAALADEVGIEWRHRLVDDDAAPPPLGQVAKLLGEAGELEDLLWGAHGEQ